ncbi:hypothetical protein CGQ24_08215 [Arthrobacter sp. 7749]|nr:hypothetical protein CGQ24_08215 [Arthrobacter sp. 7749]
MSTFTAALAVKRALYEVTRDLMLASPETEHVMVCPGAPGTFSPEDIIAFQRISVSQAPATLSSRRSREETITVEATISCFIGGDESGELPSQERAFDLLGMIERQVRVVDTTLGGVVRQCFLTSVETEGATPPEYQAQGRAVDVTAIFTAQNRVSD